VFARYGGDFREGRSNADYFAIYNEVLAVQWLALALLCDYLERPGPVVRGRSLRCSRPLRDTEQQRAGTRTNVYPRFSAPS
jgi:hypothetical protein